MVSRFAEQRQVGFRWLKFSSFVEEEFRQYYAQATASRARFIIGIALASTLVMIGTQIAKGGIDFMVGFQALIMVPILTGTLYSSRSSQYRLYQFLLVASALLIGLILNSIVTRAVLDDMPYYFGAVIAWLFVGWLILGLTFRAAALASAVLSFSYIWALMHWSVGATEALFESLTLVTVNIIGAFCCYQLEHAERRSFLESKFLSELAEQDGLTGLHNRRSFDQHLDRLWRQSRREQSQLTLMLIDIDHFKTYNDAYGHQAGDDALKRVAEVIGAAAQRPLDIACRYGGEEFALLLYGPVSEFGKDLPEQIRGDILALKIPHRKSTTSPYLTASVGVAIMMPNAERSMAGTLQMADEALYQAKDEGRNRVVIKESPHSEIQTGRFRAAKTATG